MAEMASIINSLKGSVPEAFGQSLPDDHVIARRERETNPSLSIEVHQHHLQVPRARLAGAFLITEQPAAELPALEQTSASMVGRDGTEALAWYRSYHFGTTHKWGIKIRQEGIYYLARYLQEHHTKQVSSQPDLDALDYLQVAFNFLELHEYFHFIADIACTVLELALHKGLYCDYLCSVYHAQHNKFEEAMANAYAYRVAQRQGLSAELKQFMRSQPDYYKHYGPWTGRRTFQYGRQKLVGLMCPSLVGGGDVVSGTELLFRIDHADLDCQDVPILMERVEYSGRLMPALRVLEGIQHLGHSEKFSEDYANLPQSLKMKLYEDVQSPALHFEKIRGQGSVFVCRVDKVNAISLRHCGGDTWEIMRMARHSEVVSSPE